MILKTLTKQPSYVTVTLSLDEVRLLKKAVSSELDRCLSAVKANTETKDEVLQELKKRINKNIPKYSRLKCDLSLYGSLLNCGQMDENVARAYTGYYDVEHEIHDTDESCG